MPALAEIVTTPIAPAWTQALRFAHIAAGGVALAGGALQLALEKGTPAHRALGRAYVVLLAVVAATAAVLAFAPAHSATARDPRTGAFFFYLALLALQFVVEGATAFRLLAAPPRPLERALSLATVGGGVLLALWSLAPRPFPLLIGFGLLGAWAASGALRRGRIEDPAVARSIHVGAMGASYISMLTAFLVNNSARLLPGLPWWLAWIAPTLIGLPLIARLQRAPRPVE